MQEVLELIGMRDLANHILAVARDAGEEISNLQLQKILFFIFGLIVSRAEDGDRLPLNYDLDFRRWSYGPVIPEIYFDYNNFGARPITDEDATIVEPFEIYNDEIIHLLGIDPFKLVEATHRLPSWADYEKEIMARNYVPPYQLDDFIREFRRNE